MSKKVFGFDLDEVLMDFNGALGPWHNRNYGTNYQKHEIFSFNLEKIWGCTVEEAIQRVLEFFNSPEHWNAEPIAGAVSGIRKLTEQYGLYVVTAKPEELREKTLEWISLHFPKMFDEVYFTNHFSGSNPKRSKSEVCHELGIEVFVDDALHNAEEIASAGIPVLLLDTPWNQGEVKYPITRVFSWEEIVERLSH